MTIRWALLGASRIGASSFLPALAWAGGEASLIAARNAQRAKDYASTNDVARSVEGYQRALDDPQIDAVYIALPHDLHEEWTIAALNAGKAVLCEKPLSTSVDSTRRILDAAAASGGLLWEAVVFPFHPMSDALTAMVADLGPASHIESGFDFTMEPGDDFRWSPQHGGGALFDLGCYPLGLARLIFGTEPTSATTDVRMSPEGVDTTTDGTVFFAENQQLSMYTSVERPFRVDSTIIGSNYRISIPYAFHPQPGDRVVIEQNHATHEWISPDGTAFGYAIRHINAVLRDEEAPRLTALDESLPRAEALALVRDSYDGTPRYPYHASDSTSNE